MASSEKFSPLTEIHTRCKVPEHLFILIDNVAFPTINHDDGTVVTPQPGDFHAKRDFSCEKITRDRLRAHLRGRGSTAMESCFISTFEDEDTALISPPFYASDMARSKLTIPHATKLIINTSNLHAGWIDTSLGRIPVWLEHGGLPKVPKGVLYMTPEGVEAFDASVWICIAEVRNILGLKPHHGKKGEWLACGYIPRSMVEAQVVLHNYQGQESSPLQSAVKRSGSTRSVSIEEQEEHVKEQIARNKASREYLRSTPSSKKQEQGKNNSLLRQAIENGQASKQVEREFTPTTPGNTSKKAFSLKQRATFPKPSATIEERTKTHKDSIRFASIRSSKLREALEQNQAVGSKNSLDDMQIATKSYAQDRKQKHPECFHNQEQRPSFLSDNPKRQDKTLLEGNSNIKTLNKPPRKKSLPLSHGNSKIFQPRTLTDEERETVPPSERLRRARAGKKKVKFVDSVAKPELECKPDDSMEDKVYTVDEASDVASVISDLARMSFTLPEPRLSSESGSFSDDAPPSITDEYPPLSRWTSDEFVWHWSKQIENGAGNQQRHARCQKH